MTVLGYINGDADSEVGYSTHNLAIMPPSLAKLRKEGLLYGKVPVYDTSTSGLVAVLSDPHVYRCLLHISFVVR